MNEILEPAPVITPLQPFNPPGSRRNNSALERPDAEPWHQPVIGEILLDELTAVIKRYVVLPEFAPETLALWTLHTYAFHLREVTAYLGLESPEKRCGKTTLLALLSELVNRPVVAANISPPALFRVIEEASPTLLIDEADTFLQGNDEMRGILNSGYTRKTAFVVRVSNQSREAQKESSTQLVEAAAASRLVRFSSWCPKAMAAIGRLPDTLADRCIPIRMQRKTMAEKCDRLKNLDAEVLRRCCARFILDHARAITEGRPETPPELNDRASDIWEPLLVLADLAGGAWPERARQCAIRISSGVQEANPASSLLLEILIAFTQSGTTRLASRDIVAHLNSTLSRPWAELCQGKPVDELWLSKQLKPYHVRPRLVRFQDTIARGYHQEDLSDIFRRYIPRSEIETLRQEVTAAQPLEAAQTPPEEAKTAPVTGGN
jgi:putative DNA primase/helicase